MSGCPGAIQVELKCLGSGILWIVDMKEYRLETPAAASPDFRLNDDGANLIQPHQLEWPRPHVRSS